MTKFEKLSGLYGRKMNAKFDGKCHCCGNKVHAGEEVFFQTSYRVVTHSACVTKEIESDNVKAF
jgi:hypothetical protein